jgi:hypothetical protein
MPCIEDGFIEEKDVVMLGFIVTFKINREQIEYNRLRVHYW